MTWRAGEIGRRAMSLSVAPGGRDRLLDFKPGLVQSLPVLVQAAPVRTAMILSLHSNWRVIHRE